MSETDQPHVETTQTEPLPVHAGVDDLAPTPAAEPGRLREWFWGGRAISEARQSLALLEPQMRRLRHGHTAVDLADRALASLDPPRSGPSTPFAFTHYREAAYWALLAQGPALEASSLAEAFDRADRALLESAVPSPDDLGRVRHVLVDGTFVADADTPLEQLQADGHLVSSFIRALLSVPDRSARTVARLKARRWRRVGALVVALGILTGVGVWAGMRATQGPNLAAGKPWRTSSTGLVCKPAQHLCGSSHTDILFHTQEEESPWFEIDLQRPTAFSKVDVYNRSDCCPDRALPLVIEVSNDATSWREVARQLDTFGVWKANVGKQNARYVRMRSTRRTTLHLEGAAIR